MRDRGYRPGSLTIRTGKTGRDTMDKNRHPCSHGKTIGETRTCMNNRAEFYGEGIHNKTCTPPNRPGTRVHKITGNSSRKEGHGGDVSRRLSGTAPWHGYGAAAAMGDGRERTVFERQRGGNLRTGKREASGAAVLTRQSRGCTDRTDGPARRHCAGRTGEPRERPDRLKGTRPAAVPYIVS